MIGIITLVLDIALKFLGIFIKDQAKLEEYRKKVQEETKKYQKGVEDSAKSREIDKDLDNELEKKWKEKWGTQPPKPPSA